MMMTANHLSIEWLQAGVHHVRLFIPIGLLLITTACGGNKLTNQDLHLAYQEALASTEKIARADWSAHPDALDAAVDRLENYFSTLTRTNVTELTRTIYAEDAFLCDTLHVARGADEIEAYFLKTADRIKAMRVTFIDYSAAGREVYTRWTMTTEIPNLAGGRPVTTSGISHFRFDEQGKVILQQDFWDAAAGLFEHLPVLRWLIPRIRGRL
jgi:hypothetical protein